MNKKEFVATVAETSGVTKKDAEAVIKTAFEVIAEVLSDGDKVAFTGFGTFTTKLRQERKVRNPQTGKMMKVPAAVVPCFKPGKDLKEMVNA